MRGWRVRAVARGACLALSLLAASGPARAQEFVYGVLPETDQLFRRLLADPRQAQTALRYYRLEGDNLSDVALGNIWGMARWRVGGDDDWIFQLNVEGMGYSRFQLSGGINEFRTIDFFANLPVEMRYGSFSARVTLFHESSHLGDDYIRRTNDRGFRYSVEGLGVIASYEPHPLVRVYGGGTGLLDAIPRRQEGSAQWGFELRTPDLRWHERHECWLYLAQDFKSLGRVRWNLNSKTNLGFRMGIPKVIRALRMHAGYFGGHSEYGQFFRDKEHYFDLGVSFDF
ncbi:MAG: DUF1207 domain-containing protein [Elusimicrobiota bacterium]